MVSQPMCQRCGQAIWGNYITALGAIWHPEHFMCVGCGKPIGITGYTLHQGEPYHAECYRSFVAPRCVYCNKPLVGEYLVDHWGTRFCKEHQREYAACPFCGRLIPPRDLERNSDGTPNIRCSTCRTRAIELAVEAKPIFARLIQWVNSQGLMYHQLRLSVELCSRAKLADLLKDRHGTHALGATMSSTYMQGGQTLRTEISGVAVLQGLPSILFQGVTIHELGHVWLIVHSIRSLPTWAEEGFCELLSHRYYLEVNTVESLYHASGIARNTDMVYGEGFRRMRDLAEVIGFQRCIEILRTTKRLPTR